MDNGQRTRSRSPLSTIHCQLSIALLLRHPRPRILESHRPIEDEPLGTGIGIDTKVAKALELEAGEGLGIVDRWFELCARHDLQRPRIEVIKKIAALLGVLRLEQPVVKPHFAIDGMTGRHPV